MAKNCRVLSKQEFINRYMADTGLFNVKRSANGEYRFSERQLNDIRWRWKNGQTITSIGKKYGCSRQTIRRRLEQAG